MKRKLFLIPVIFSVALLLGGFMIYQRGLRNLTPKEQIFLTLQKLGKLTLLPSNDHPEMATIVNADLLRSQSPFYLNARAGDQLLIFPDAKKAYLYRPSTNVLINTGPLIVQADASPQPTVLPTSASASAVLLTPRSALPTVEVRNGTDTVGYAKKVGTQLKEKHYIVLATGDAGVKTYTATSVIGLDASVPAAALQTIATLVGGNVSSQLPEGEASSSAQILVILGK